MVTGMLAGLTMGAAAEAQQAASSRERHRVVSEPNEIISVLESGMTVLVRRVPSPVVSVRGYSLTGGVYEGPWLGGGMSHLLEHLVAGGTTSTRSEAEGRQLLQQIGNVSNAYTSYDHTGYFINTTPEHAETAIDLLCDWLLRAQITEEEYRREYEVVQRELEQGRGEPRRQFWQLMMLNRYRESPMRVPIIGYQEVIRGLSVEDVREYYRLTYQPQNLVIAIAGDVDPERMLAVVLGHVGDAAPGRQFVRDVPQEPAVLSPRTVAATMPQLGQAQLAVAFPTVRLDHEDLYALDVLAAVLGWGESALLVEEVRDRRRLVSSVSAYNWTPHWVDGTFVITMQLDPDNVAGASAAVLEMIEQVREHGVDAERVERAKAQMRAQQVTGRQTAESIADSMARDFIATGDAHFTERYVEAIQRVTVEQVQDVAQRWLREQVLLTTVMYPQEYVGAEGVARAVDLLRPTADELEAQPEEPAVLPVTRVELDNGTILLHRKMTTVPLVVMHKYSLGGLTAEGAESNGLGNLAMQLLPRGTENRTAAQVATFFDSIGGSLSTACGNNTWYSQVTCLKENVDEAFEVWADVVLNPSFPADELEAMRRRTLAAIAAQDADWHAAAFRFFRQSYFGPRQSPYQFDTLGRAETVSEFTTEQVRDWYRQHVLPARRVIAVYGDIELEHARRLTEEHFGQLAPPADEVAALDPRHNRLPGAEGEDHLIVTRVEVQQTPHPVAGIFIGFESESVLGDELNYPLTVANTMASGFRYPTGYLHETLRGRGLVYMVHAQNWAGRDDGHPGVFMVMAGCEPARVNEVVELILENIARLQSQDEQDLVPGWFDRSKRLIVTNDALQKETASDQAMQAALDELYGLGYDRHERFPERIEAVELGQVNAAVRERLRRAVVTISTPQPEAVNIEPGERRYESFHPVDLTPRGVEHAPVGGP